MIPSPSRRYEMTLDAQDEAAQARIPTEVHGSAAFTSPKAAAAGTENGHCPCTTTHLSSSPRLPTTASLKHARIQPSAPLSELSRISAPPNLQQQQQQAPHRWAAAPRYAAASRWYVDRTRWPRSGVVPEVVKVVVPASSKWRAVVAETGVDVMETVEKDAGMGNEQDKVDEAGVQGEKNSGKPWEAGGGGVGAKLSAGKVDVRGGELSTGDGTKWETGPKERRNVDGVSKIGRKFGAEVEVIGDGAERTDADLVEVTSVVSIQEESTAMLHPKTPATLDLPTVTSPPALPSTAPMGSVRIFSHDGETPMKLSEPQIDTVGRLLKASGKSQVPGDARTVPTAGEEDLIAPVAHLPATASAEDKSTIALLPQAPPPHMLSAKYPPPVPATGPASVAVTTSHDEQTQILNNGCEPMDLCEPEDNQNDYPIAQVPTIRSVDEYETSLGLLTGQGDPMRSKGAVNLDTSRVPVKGTSEDENLIDPDHPFPVTISNGPSQPSTHMDGSQLESPYLATTGSQLQDQPVVYPSLSQFSAVDGEDDERTASREPTPAPRVKVESHDYNMDTDEFYTSWSQEVRGLLNAIGNTINTVPSIFSSELPHPAPALVAPARVSAPSTADSPSSHPKRTSPLPVPVKSQTRPPSGRDSDSDVPVAARRRRKRAERPPSITLSPRLETPISFSSPTSSTTPTPGADAEANLVGPIPSKRSRKHLKRKRDLPSQTPSQDTSPPPTIRPSSVPPARKKSARTRTTRASLAISSLPEHIERMISNFGYYQSYAWKFFIENVSPGDIFENLIEGAAWATFGISSATRINTHGNQDLKEAIGDINYTYLIHALDIPEAPQGGLTEEQFEVLKTGEDSFEDWLDKVMLSVNLRISVLWPKPEQPPEKPLGDWKITVSPKPPPPPPLPQPGSPVIKKEIIATTVGASSTRVTDSSKQCGQINTSLPLSKSSSAGPGPPLSNFPARKTQRTLLEMFGRSPAASMPSAEAAIVGKSNSADLSQST